MFLDADDSEELDTTLKDFYEAEMPEQDAEDAEDFEPPCDADDDEDIEEEDEEEDEGSIPTNTHFLIYTF